MGQAMAEAGEKAKENAVTEQACAELEQQE
jgi:hypothetical protein